MSSDTVTLKKKRVSQSKVLGAENTEAPISTFNFERHKIKFPDLSDSFDPDFKMSKDWSDLYDDFLLDRGGLKKNTVKMLASSLRVWDQHCSDIGVYSFPIEASTLKAWFSKLAMSGKKKTTLQQHKAQLSYFYKSILLTKDNPIESSIIKQFFRSYISDYVEKTGLSIKEKQALPLRLSHLKQIKKFAESAQNRGNILYQRDFVFISIAYGLTLRYDEIRNLRKWQIKIIKRRGNPSIKVFRTTSKTSDSPLPKELKGDFAKVVIKYIDTYCADLKDEEYIFSKLTFSKGLVNKNKPLSEPAVINFFKRYWDFIKPNDIEIDDNTHLNWTGHSARVGGAIDGYEMGMSVDDLMALGDWTNRDTLMRYLRNSKVKASINEKLQLSLES